ncbi:MAG: hypothetical protein ACM3QS_14285, partial [Bacteroidota bacterium]
FDSRPASAFISTAADVESGLVEALAVDKEKARGVKKISWGEMTSLVLAPQWERTAEKYAPLFGLLTPSQLPELARNRADLFAKMAHLGKFLPQNVAAEQVAAEEQTRMITNVVGSTLIAALRRQGWKVSTGPGEDVTLCLGKRSIKPFEAYWKLEKGEVSAEEWQRICADSGISEVELRDFRAST